MEKWPPKKGQEVCGFLSSRYDFFDKKSCLLSILHLKTFAAVFRPFYLDSFKDSKNMAIAVQSLQVYG